MPAWNRGVLLQVVLFGWVDCWNKTLSGYVRLVDCRCGGVLGMGRQSSVAPTDVTTRGNLHDVGDIWAAFSFWKAAT